MPESDPLDPDLLDPEIASLLDALRQPPAPIELSRRATTVAAMRSAISSAEARAAITLAARATRLVALVAASILAVGVLATQRDLRSP